VRLQEISNLLLGKRLDPIHPGTRAERSDFVKLAGFRISSLEGTSEHKTDQIDLFGDSLSLFGAHSSWVNPDIRESNPG
jgi:hypothetical protein